MPQTYTGSPSADHGVELPALSHAVEIKMLTDLVDPLNSSAIHGCSVNVLADWIEFLKVERRNMAGVDTWDSTKAYTAGYLVKDSNPNRVYRALVSEGNTDKRPSANTGTYWEQCDFSRDEIKAFSAAHVQVNSPTGITTTQGATVTRSDMIVINNTFRIIFMTVGNVPNDNATMLDLNGCETKFLSLCLGAIAGLASGWYSYGANEMVGANFYAESDKNKINVWCKQGTSPVTAGMVSLILFGV